MRAVHIQAAVDLPAAGEKRLLFFGNAREMLEYPLIHVRFPFRPGGQAFFNAFVWNLRVHDRALWVPCQSLLLP